MCFYIIMHAEEPLHPGSHCFFQIFSLLMIMPFLHCKQKNVHSLDISNSGNCWYHEYCHLSLHVLVMGEWRLSRNYFRWLMGIFSTTSIMVSARTWLIIAPPRFYCNVLITTAIWYPPCQNLNAPHHSQLFDILKVHFLQRE